MNDFYELLDKCIALLQERGRISCRALKLQLHIDDDTLEALKDELIYSRQLATNEDNRVLIWSGAASSTDKPEHGPERRQISVMFCDLVGSTALSTRFDPEDLRDIIRAYQLCCEKMVERYQGFLSRFMGDGVLVYFGYPAAHEYDTEQAIRAGLAIVEEVKQLQLYHGLRLQTRIGIATGSVVVGELIGKEQAQERTVVGETPNLAARLQTLAQPDEVIIADSTQRLVRGLFECDDLGEKHLKGFSLPTRVWRVRAERQIESRFDAIHANSNDIPLVGREEETDLLKRRWQQAKQGEGSAVLLMGEPGIGKSRLVKELRDLIGTESHCSIRYYCAPFYQSSALHPVINQLERAAQFNRDDSPTTKLDKLEALLDSFGREVPESLPLLAALLSIPTEGRYPPLNLAPQRQKERTLAVLQTWLAKLAVDQRLLLIFEDLHWVDPTTREFLDGLLNHDEIDSILLLLTARPEFENPWNGAPALTTLMLQRLRVRNSSEIVLGLTGGKQLPSELMDQIMEKTDGVPLFVEELTKTVLEAGFLRSNGDHYDLNMPLPELAVPDTLQDSLMSRLDRLAPVREVAQTGAMIGRQFSYELIAAMSPLNRSALRDALRQLGDAGIITGRGTGEETIYTFKHALVQDAAYHSLLRSKRQNLHARLAQVLVTEFPEIKATQPELIAHHYTAAGLAEQAIEYWQQAGDYALRRSANLEAIDHLQRGLNLLEQLPASEHRNQRELSLQMSFGAALITTRGYTDAAVEQTYARAQTLCAHAGDSPALFWVVMGLHLYHIVRGDLPEALTLAERLEQLAKQFSELRSSALIALGSSHFLGGRFQQAEQELSQAFELADPDDHSYLMNTGIDLRTLALAFGSLCLWHLGFPDQARARGRQAIELADATQHPHTQVAARVFAGAELGHYLQDTASIAEAAKYIVDVSEQLGFLHWLTEGYIFQSCGQFCGSIIAQDDTTHLEQLKTMVEQHAGIAGSYFLAMLAEIQQCLSHPQQALQTLQLAEQWLQEHGDRFWSAEVYRLHGAFILNTQNDQVTAEQYLQQSLTIAEQQGSKSLALRTAVSLGKLWQQQNQQEQAQELVQQHYQSFIEGFDTLDLKAAEEFLGL